MRITCEQGDITTVEVDAVVNAANSRMRGGGGVDGAIHRAGGPAVLADCVARFPDGLPVGGAGWTTAGDLPARWVIHCVGPVWTSSQDRSALLASCYRNALAVADELGARTVAFPAISAGAFGWPVHDAARIAVATVRGTPTEVAQARFVLFSPLVLQAFRGALGEPG